MHSKTHNSLIRFASTLLMVAALSVPLAAVRAQDAGNLLVNGNMEGGFAARDGVSGVPLGWAFFIISGALDADRQAFAPYAFSPPTFWAMRSSFGSWTAGGRQTVAVQQGQNYRLGAHAFIWTCNDPQWSCIPSDAPRFSNTESGARVKIGIDPNGGVDPLSTAIIWSAWIQPWNSYTGITVEAQAISGQMSVFLLAESGSAMAFNEVYWDDITLSPFGGTVAGQVPATAGQSAAVVAPPPAAVPQTVPFVQPQQARPDGSLVHVVVAGDTLNSILFAYTSLGISREQVMQLNGWRYEPQFIVIGDEIVLLPPGSIDPASGTVLTTGSTTSAAATPPPSPILGAPPATTAPPAEDALPVPQTLTAGEINTIPVFETIPVFLP